MKNENAKITITKLKKMWKDKRGKAAIKLSLYFIFFFAVILFARISSNRTINSNQENNNSFIYSIKDNYERNISITIDEDHYQYYEKRLGNNFNIIKKINDTEEYYYFANNKYYILDDNGNYILTTSSEVYPYINNSYLNINNIRNFINTGTKENNIYQIKVSDMVLNTNSEEYITIKLSEEDTSIEINYTNLFKIDNENVESAVVNIKYANINKITSLAE